MEKMFAEPKCSRCNKPFNSSEVVCSRCGYRLAPLAPDHAKYLILKVAAGVFIGGLAVVGVAKYPAWNEARMAEAKKQNDAVIAGNLREFVATLTPQTVAEKCGKPMREFANKFERFLFYKNSADQSMAMVFSKNNEKPEVLRGVRYNVEYISTDTEEQNPKDILEAFPCLLHEAMSDPPKKDLGYLTGAR